MVGSIHISNLNKIFTNRQKETVTALSDVNIDIEPNSFISLIGPSGCGKSTTLRIIAGFETADSGIVNFEGKDLKSVPANKRNINTVFQNYALFPHMDVGENIAFSLRVKGVDEASIKKKVSDALELVNLKGFERRRVDQLSGGMCQRASLARALVGYPSVLLLDEPLGALDAFTRMNIQDEILRIKKEKNMTMIMVTHDVDEAVYLSDRIVVMTPRPGRVTSIVDVDLPRPRDRSDYDFLKYHGEILRLLKFGGFKQSPEYII